jgi:hypothetical protein
MGCETFREKRFENYFATVSSVRNYIFRKVLRGNAYAMIISISLKNGFRVAKKR